MLVHTERGLWAVADGMGGHDAGEVASAMVVDALRRVPLIGNLDDLAGEAVAVLGQVNRELIGLARSQDRDRTIGTTVAGLAIADGSFRCFWAGDSRAYRLRGGNLTRLTRDHSLVQDLVDAGMIRPDEAEGHENSNVITRAVGVAEELNVDTLNGDARPGDLFLLASDGLTRVVADHELALELERGTLEHVADNLIETVLARGAPDNVSLIMVRLLE